MAFTSMERALQAIAAGGMVIVADDEDRENEGDLIMAAEAATEEAVSFMTRHTSGLICASLSGERLAQLHLPLMVPENSESMKTAFTVSVDYKYGTTTGISAADRALTLRQLANVNAVAEDFARPGHVFPLQAAAGGVLERAGHTEAALDLTRLAGLTPGGVLCEIVNDDGSMARRGDLERFAGKHNLPMISIADLITYRKQTEKLVRRVSEARLPTRHGDFTAISYESDLDGHQHLALVMGEVGEGSDALVRVHSECLTGDVLGSLRCDCGAQLEMAMAKIGAEGRGCIVYLRGQEGRGIGLAHKMRAYALQDQGYDTVQANASLGLPVDARDYTVGAQILADLGITGMRLMTNNPQKYEGIKAFGLTISSRIPLVIEPNPENLSYLKTKQEKMGHILEFNDMPRFHALPERKLASA